MLRDYFFAGVDWLLGRSDSTERWVVARDIMIVNPIEVSIKMMAE